MEIVPGFFMPLWGIIASITAAAALLIFIITRILLNLVFLKKCERASADAEALEALLEQYPKSRRLSYSRLIEKAADRNGRHFLEDIGISDLWDREFLISRKKKYLKKFLKYYPEKGLFYCILAGEHKKSCRKIFLGRLEKNCDVNLLKKIGTASAGTDFDGKYAAELLTEDFQQLIELTGDSEWPVRHFAIKTLIHIDDPRAVRACWEAFGDSSDRIRETAAREFKSEDGEKLGKTLLNLLLEDPAFNVRRASRLRLDGDFPELYRMDTDRLTKPQLVHLLGHLHDGSDEDENTALKYLLSDDLEIRLQAALYLQKQHVLNRIFVKAAKGDRTDYKRCLELLTKACEVNCTAFFDELEKTENPAAIELAAELLSTNGGREIIDRLCAKVFSPVLASEMHEHYLEIYRKAVSCVSKRGSDRAMRALNQELQRKSTEASFLEILLPSLPGRGEDIFIPTLLSFLKDGDFPLPGLLRETIERFPPALYIEELISLLKQAGGRSRSVRREAFKILGELKMSCCMQIILENLPLLSSEERKEFAKLMSVYDQNALEDRIYGLLKSPDAAVKAALINALPETGIKKFIDDIKQTAKDPDPDVRIAGIWALAGYNETRSLSQMTSMLRDPVERVRKESAAVIAGYGSPSALEELKKTIHDKNEVLPVKASAVFGLGNSGRSESINILVDALPEEDLRPEAVAALARKNSKSDLKLLIELFRDASPQLREHIAEAFKKMGQSAEAAVMALLAEDIPSMREILAEILQKTGFIDATVRKLRHRKPSVRKGAAALLARLQTREAFKGIVLAARDPDQDVRVEVLKALEKLNSPDGADILEELKSDPDRRVRKYTLWALERLEARNMDEE